MHLEPKFIYKEILKRVRRLPLDNGSLERCKLNIRSNFIENKKRYPDRKRFERSLSLLDSILIDGEYYRLKEVLDTIYKSKVYPDWLRIFLNTKYLALQSVWPQVHLAHELTSDSHFTMQYDTAIQKEYSDDISIADFLHIPHDDELNQRNLLPLKKSKSLNPLTTELMFKVTKFHKFLVNNQTRLTHLKIQPFEVIYTMNRFSFPIHVNQRQRMLRQKVSYIKNLCKKFRPIEEQNLNYIISAALYKPGQGKNKELEINANFFKFLMKKKRNDDVQLSPMIKKHVRIKNLVPNDNNIRKILRSYVREQFYLSDGEYKLSRMENLFENSHRITNYNAKIM